MEDSRIICTWRQEEDMKDEETEREREETREVYWTFQKLSLQHIIYQPQCNSFYDFFIWSVVESMWNVSSDHYNPNDPNDNHPNDPRHIKCLGVPLPITTLTTFEIQVVSCCHFTVQQSWLMSIPWALHRIFSTPDKLTIIGISKQIFFFRWNEKEL